MAAFYMNPNAAALTGQFESFYSNCLHLTNYNFLLGGGGVFLFRPRNRFSERALFSLGEPVRRKLRGHTGHYQACRYKSANVLVLNRNLGREERRRWGGDCFP